MNHKISQLKAGAHIHMVGICGTAMASLAGLLKDRGFKVTGSDANPYPPMSTQIEKLGIPLMKGYAKENLNPRPDFVIIGNVIPASNPEAVEILAQKIPYTSLPAAMGESIIENRESIVIAGTHGKTTTTSLMAWVADQVGVKPGFLIGGIPKNFSLSFRNPAGNYFVIEGDEYDTAFFDKVPKFIHYKPKHVVFTSCEFDHADIYADLDAVKSAFLRLMKLIPPAGTLMYWGEDDTVAKVAAASPCKNKFSYGMKKGDYVAEILDHGGANNGKTKFRVKKSRGNEVVGEFLIGLSGEYNILNATAVVGLATELNWDLKKVAAAFASFEGVKRRQEVLGEPDRVLVIEDFAHHPTAVRETLKGLKSRYPGRKLWAVFEPRSATSRRKVFQKDYVEAFKGADEICLAKAFDQSKINESERFSSEQLVQDLKNAKKAAEVFSSADEIAAHLTKSAKPGEMIVVMSNGGFDGIYQKLLGGLSARAK